MSTSRTLSSVSLTVPISSTAGPIAAVAAGHSAVAGFVTGGAVALAVLLVLMRWQNSAWRQIRQHPYFRLPEGGCAVGWQRKAQPVTVDGLAETGAGAGHRVSRLGVSFRLKGCGYGRNLWQ